MESAFGIQFSQDKISIKYDSSSSASFDENGYLIKSADLLFLGGGKSISESRNKKALFAEFNKNVNSNFDILCKYILEQKCSQRINSLFFLS